MSGYQRNIRIIVIAAALLAGCSEPPKACVCPNETGTAANDMPNAQNTNILASLIQISQIASQNPQIPVPQPAWWPDALTDKTQDPQLIQEGTGQPEPTVLAEQTEPSNDDASLNSTDIDTGEPSPVPNPQTDMVQIANVSARSTTIGAFHGIKGKKIARGMPRNSHQVPEGYWIGSKPNIEQLKSLHNNNIKLIVTASRMGEEDLAKIQEEVEALGMKQLNIPFGGKFPKPEKFMNVIKKFKPDQIYIHCDHGGDRSGALLAYLLVIEQGWSIPKALFAVLYPGPNDINGLNDVLRNRGFDASDKDYHDIMGMYSAENNGGFGGLKVRSSNYQKLVNSLIDAMMKSQS